MSRKASQAGKMFEELVKQMNHSLHLERKTKEITATLPPWLNDGAKRRSEPSTETPKPNDHDEH